MARTILVADDSPTIQKKASGILTGEGLEVVTVSNGVAAVKKLPTVKPLVVLADVSMPGKDGYEVCEFVKKSADLSHVAVVLIFSDTDPYEARRGTSVNADGTIRKPFDHQELITTVQKFLARAEAAAAPRAAAPPPPPAELAYVTEPVDEEPEVEERPKGPDLSAFSGGMAFGEPAAGEEASALEPQAAPAPADERAEAPVEAAPSFDSTASLEAPSGPRDFYAPPEPLETPLPEPQAPSEPMLVEEPSASERRAEPAPETPESTLQFHSPADIAPPVLSEEVEAGSESVSGPTTEPPFEPGEPPAARETLESYTLSEAAQGQVRFGAAAATSHAAEEERLAAPPPALDRGRVYDIVHKVVAKMSPPAFPAQAIEEMARKFTDEILSELGL